MNMYSMDERFKYGVVKSSRKTVSIEVKVGGQVVVKAPIGLSDREIRDCVASKEKWILDKIQVMERVLDKMPERHFQTGETLYLLGEPYVLERKTNVSGRKPKIFMTGKSIIIYGSFQTENEIRKLIEEWYQKKAEERIIPRMEYYKERIGVEFRRVRFGNPKTRWGSCSGEKNIMINWRLVMAPLDIIDYIVCHELCHLKEMNHSQSFWSLVEKEIPDWRGKRAWLRENGYTLTV